MDIDIAKAQVAPDEIVQYIGPRNELDTWEYHFMTYDGCKAQIDASWSDAANSKLTDLYTRWSQANESYMISLLPLASSKQTGRGSSIQFEEVQASFSIIDSQVYVASQLSSWEQLGTMLRTFRGMLRNGTSTDQAGPVMESIGSMVKEFDAKAPSGTDELVAKLKKHVCTALQDKAIISDTRESILVVNDLLATAIKQHGLLSSKA